MQRQFYPYVLVVGLATASAGFSAPLIGGISVSTHAERFLHQAGEKQVKINREAVHNQPGWSPAMGWAYGLTSEGKTPDSILVEARSGAIVEWVRGGQPRYGSTKDRKLSAEETGRNAKQWLLTHVPHVKGRRLEELGHTTLGGEIIDYWLWVERIGPFRAISPNTVSAEISAVTGEIVQFSAPMHRITVPVIPTVPKERALSISNVAIGPPKQYGTPETDLTVRINPLGVQSLQWIVAYPLPVPPGQKRAATDYARVYVDALTGEIALVTAPFGGAVASRFPKGRPTIQEVPRLRLSINAEEEDVHPSPKLKSESVLVPVEALQRLGIRVEHNWAQSDAVLTYPSGRRLRLRAGQTTAKDTANGVVTLDVSPELSGGRLWVPLRPFAQLNRWSVQWNGKERSLDLTRPISTALHR